MSNIGNNNNGKRNIVPPHKYKYYDPPLVQIPVTRSSSISNPQQRAPSVLSVPNVTSRINIEAEVDDLADLINIGKNVGTEFKLEPHIEYNIDLAMIKNLLPEMEDLNNMIGQQEFKRQVVTLILYYSMRLNRKNDDLLRTAIYGEPGIGKTEFAQKLANIYLKLGVLKNNIFRKF